MFEEQQQLINKIEFNNKSILQIEEENKNIKNELTAFAYTLIGKCYSQTIIHNKIFYKPSAVTKQSPNFEEYIEKLDNVFQIIGVQDDSFIIQQAKEVIRKVAPKDRLTWENNILKYSIEKFISSTRNEISLDEFLRRIRKMQQRDSYRCWKTSITITL